MDDFCHKEKVKGHVGVLKQRFSKVKVGAALAGGAVATAGLGATVALTAGLELILLGD